MVPSPQCNRGPNRGRVNKEVFHRLIATDDSCIEDIPQNNQKNGEREDNGEKERDDAIKYYKQYLCKSLNIHHYWTFLPQTRSTLLALGNGDGLIYVIPREEAIIYITLPYRFHFFNKELTIFLGYRVRFQFILHKKVVSVFRV
jgi:hypothetical protein